MQRPVWPDQLRNKGHQFAAAALARRTRQSAATWGIWLVALCAMCGSTSAAEPATTPKQRILKDWTARQHVLRSVKFVLKGCGIDPRRLSGRANDPDRPPKIDPKVNREETLFIDLANGKVRRESHFYEFQRGQEPQPRSAVAVYNGADVKVYWPPADNPVSNGARFVSLVLSDLKQGSANLYDLGVRPVFWSVGILDPDQLSKPHFAHVFGDADFDFVSDSKPQNESSNRRARKLGDKLRHSSETMAMTWFVDPEKNSAVTDFRSRLIGAHYLIGNSFGVEVSEYRHDEHGWFPAKWIAYGRREPLEYELIDITFEPELPAALFELPAEFLKPGMFVSEKRELKTVAADGHSLVPVQSESENGS